MSDALDYSFGPPFEFQGEPLLLYEDADFLVVRKPPKMHSLPGQGSADLCSWLFSRYPEVAAANPDSLPEGGLMHRLDYETSGLVLFARGAEACERLRREQGQGRFVKEYRALVAPRQGLAMKSGPAFPEGSRPSRGLPLGPEPSLWEEALAAAGEERAETRAGLGTGAKSDDAEALLRLARLLEGAAIESRFRPYGPKAARVSCLGEKPEVLLKAKAVKDRALSPLYRSAICAAEIFQGYISLRLRIQRGFRHQLRAHLAWLGLPILGDPLYGDRPAPRLFLHAHSLEFIPRDRGAPIRIEDA